MACLHVKNEANVMFFIIYMDLVSDGICLKKAADRSAAFYILY